MRHLPLALGLWACTVALATIGRAQGPATPPPTSTVPVPTAPPVVPAPPPTAGQPAPQPYPPGYYNYSPYPVYPQPYAYSYPPPASYRPPPLEVPYVAGQAPPDGYTLEERPRKGLVIAGAIVLGVGYLPALSSGLSGEDSTRRWLLVPVVGPWIFASRNDDKCKDIDCVGRDLENVLWVMDGIVQLTGGILLTVGLAATKKVWVRDTGQNASTSMVVVPTMMGGRGAGLMVQAVGF